MADWELLRRLCEARGVSGAEDEVREILKKEAEPYAASLFVDPLGNLIVEKRGANRPAVKLMLDAHMDEVGMIVTHITEDGLLRFTPVGGIDRRVLGGRQVLVDGRIPGVIGVKPTHLLEPGERDRAPKAEDLAIDIGAKDRAEAEAAVTPGDPATFLSPFAFGETVKSKALDDRAGCALLVELLRQELPYDMTFVFSVQEEVGLRGAKTAAYTVAPDAAIVLESTTAADVAGVGAEKQVCRLGKGPVVSFMDRRTLYDRAYCQLAFRLARELGVPAQAKEAVAGGNNAGAVHQSRGGVRTLALSLPCRYLHAPAGVIARSDYEAMLRLLPQVAAAIAGGQA